MKTPQEYLQRTESASRILFEGIVSYTLILRESPPPVFVHSCDGHAESEEQIQKREKAYADWESTQDEAIQISREAQRKFVAESFALGVLCGSVLQIAYMGIQLFPRDDQVSSDLPEAFEKCITDTTKKICIGRISDFIPIGLIIYAGRNQYNHIDDKGNLRNLNRAVFNHLAGRYDHLFDKPYKDPPFDLESPRLTNYAHNITGLLGWRDYESYEKDMRELLEVDN